jgi:DNA modification methylase
VSWKVLQGDCIERMVEMEEASVDAVVCDPPYGIGFMGKEWDGRAIAEAAAKDRATRKSLGPESPSRPNRAQPRGSSAFGNEAIIAGPVRGGIDFQEWCQRWAAEALRVLKPGGYLLAFGGTRTYHRLAAGVEDAGFEIRDSLLWLYGSGFPKSLNVAKAIDSGGRPEDPSSDAAQWEGWGTALKPSHEPIVVARKPLIGTVAENALEHGTGGINVDGCRIGSGGASRKIATEERDGSVAAYGDGLNGGGGERDLSFGRWPANVVLSHLEECEPVGTKVVKPSNGSGKASAKSGGLSGLFGEGSEEDMSGGRGSAETVDAWNCAPGCPVTELDAQSGVLHSQDPETRKSRSKRQGVTEMGTGRSVEYADRGGASRFFYCAKTSRAERNAGLESFPDVVGGFRSETSGQHLTRRDGGDPDPTKNGHPTVKPINLMRWLVRLVTPSGGLILDPFLGSGTTGCAAVLEGFDFIGIEREAEYVAIAGARIEFWAQHEGCEVEDVLGLVSRSERVKRAHAQSGQLGLEAAQA